MISLEVLTKLVDDFKIDGELAYKKRFPNYIIVMKKLVDTITNESRADVVDSANAKFRADKLEVVLIINVRNGTTTQQTLTNWFNNMSVQYTVGRIVKPDKFDDNLNVVCSSGIHYFKSLERAYFYMEKGENGLLSENGLFKEWYDSGAICNQCTYSEGKLNGPNESWYINSVPCSKCNYKDNELNGPYTSWHNNGKYYVKGSYVNGKKNGLYESWYDNGNPSLRGNFDSDTIIKSYKIWNYIGENIN